MPEQPTRDELVAWLVNRYPQHDNAVAAAAMLEADGRLRKAARVVYESMTEYQRSVEFAALRDALGQ